MEHQRTYTWTDAAQLLAMGAGMSGLEFLTAMKERRIPPPPVGSLIGVSGMEVEKGKVAIGFDPQEFHYNPLGVVHGGVIATVIDIVLGCAVHSTLKARQGFATLTLELKYHRAVTAKSGHLRAEARIVTRGREIANAEATLKDGKDRLFASATSTLTVFTAPPGV